MPQNSREAWSGKLGFIMATVGSAVGIGSIWKFPYEVGSNGGGAFVLLYVLGLIVIVVPLMLAEFAIGRRGDPGVRAGERWFRRPWLMSSQRDTVVGLPRRFRLPA